MREGGNHGPNPTERNAQLRSFRTNEPISSHLVEAVAIRNVIEKLVGSGLADHEVANAWKKGREELEDRVRRNDAPSRFRSNRWG